MSVEILKLFMQTTEVKTFEALKIFKKYLEKQNREGGGAYES